MNPPTGDSPGQRRLSHELERLILKFAERPVTLGDLVQVLQTRGYLLLLIVLSLPFCTPVPLPGVSTPFGVVICVIGFRLALRQRPWLPERLLRLRLPPRFFSRLLAAGRRLVLGLEFLLCPRWNRLAGHPAMHHLGGLIVLASGALLLLPLPVPFSNFLPAFTIVLMAAALLERDGLAALAAWGFFAASLVFFGAIIWGGAEAAGWLQDRFGNEPDAAHEQHP